MRGIKGTRGTNGFVPADERFIARVKVGGPDECWPFGRGEGYHVFRPEPGVRVLAHRYAYELWVGPIPDGMQVDHLCRHPWCVNPKHLEPVTSRINTLRGVSPAAKRALITHCPAGHPYDEVNTYVSPRNERKCRACGALRARERRYADTRPPGVDITITPLGRQLSPRTKARVAREEG